MKYNKLVISPHADDEVLGCGGSLDKDTFVFYIGINENSIKEKTIHRIPLEERKKEISNVANFFGFSYKINEENKVNNYKLPSIISQIEETINFCLPEKIFIPFPSYNQDHEVVYNASRVALRPHDKNWFVKKVLTYEQPHSIIWEDKNFSVQYYIEIDLQKKLEGYLMHKSQVREFRSPEILEAIARLRGASIGKKYAEAYRIERWVE